jgi:hypothetical protein
MQLIALAGPARVGKDTIGEHLHKRFNYARYAFAGPLKEMVHVGLGLSPRDYQSTEQKESVIPWLGVSYRHITQTLGTEWMRDRVNSQGWVIIAERNIQQMADAGTPGCVITDMRFDNEAEWVRKVGGTVVHVKGKRAQIGMSEEAKKHASEKGVTFGPEDRVIVNDGTFEELHEQVERLVYSLMFLETVGR